MSLSQLKVPISSLPITPKSRSLQHNLIPDSATPSHSEFVQRVLLKNPSIIRRSRLVDSKAHFSFVTPLHLPFPYEIEPPENEEDKTGWIEKWLSLREPLVKRQPPVAGTQLDKYASEERDKLPERHLLGIAPSALRDCFPQLDVGDAFQEIGTPALLPSPNDANGTAEGIDEKARQIRGELVDVLGGHTVLMSNETPYLPWSLRYCGHQFGVWAGQLGDGRAISIMEVPHPSNPEHWEIQLKGAGRTPYSRGADGLAVLRSSIREYLGSEAVHALRIPSTRALSLIHVPELPVYRETKENAAIVARLSPSFIRIGSFEAHNPPADIFFMGMGAMQPQTNYESLRILGEWVVKNVLKLERKDDRAPWGKELVLECARRNAKMVAGWQAYGFMHGVMNTDNISIIGLTMDYGPFAFMDVFERNHICNHTDEQGRYNYNFQPAMIQYAVRALLRALGPLIGAEEETGRAVEVGWADSADKEKLAKWKRKAEELEDIVDEVVQNGTVDEYLALMRKRLGLLTSEPTDEADIVNDLLTKMQNQNLDFHITFRTLCAFSPTAFLEEEKQEDQFYRKKVIKKIVPGPNLSSLMIPPQDAETLLEAGRRDMESWLVRYAHRVVNEKEAWMKRLSKNSENANKDAWEKERETYLRNYNPRFVLRQWVLEEVIKKCGKDTYQGKRILAKVMEMTMRPFEPWGAEFVEDESGISDPEKREERRYCDVGSREMLGFQCSCSS